MFKPKAGAVAVFSLETVLDRQDNPMSAKIKSALIGAMIFGSSSVALAREPAANHAPDGACSAIQTACLPWQAPIGHRQPEVADISKVKPLPSDLELQALDQAIDRKLNDLSRLLGHRLPKPEPTRRGGTRLEGPRGKVMDSGPQKLASSRSHGGPGHS